LHQERYADLIDYTIPNVSTQFSANCVESLQRVLAKVQADGPEILAQILGMPDADEESEDEPDEDDVENSADQSQDLVN
jgi:hypothetical protein